MKAILTVLIFLVMVRFTEELTWNTKMGAAVCCQGNTQRLIWNFTLGENERVTELHWYFNGKTLVCFVTNATGFVEGDLYEGRVEWNGIAEILLKNVHLSDTGEYTLFVKLEVETEHNNHGINLTVAEPPPSQCKPVIKKTNSKGIISCFTSCEISPLPLEWIINGTKVPEDSGPFFAVNSLGTSEQPSCCLRGFKCLDDYETKFCTRNNISFTEDMHTVNELYKDTTIPILISLLVTENVLITLVIVVCVKLKIRHRLFLKFHKRHNATNDDLGIQCKELLSETRFPILGTVPELNADVRLEKTEETLYPILGTVPELNADVRLEKTEEKTFPILDADDRKVQLQVAVESNYSNTVAQCYEDLQQASTIAANSDRLVQDANQRVQIVNNISIDTGFLDRLLDLKAEVQASKRETMILKRQLLREKNLRKKENRHRCSLEMTPGKRRYYTNGEKQQTNLTP
ncbi:hypothetical protein ACJMK2_026042 [Sinanodonta woodiana]|uniref:Ig-like domain-containing protein n=1 Tax=Sinanodonta woodiana TaxID=1069815 RepID=A0ABD3XK55_SINWO